jgi:predicted nucleic acid-binding protein
VVVVDSSVWIDFVRTGVGPHVERLVALIGRDDVIVGDLIFCEVLKGASAEPEARRLEALLLEFPIVQMCDLNLARRAGEHYRRLRALGFTIRNTLDLLIGTYCIEHGHTLLHSGRDFDAMRDHLGLKTL